MKVTNASNGDSRHPTAEFRIKYFGTFHTMGEKLVFDVIDASIARQKT